MQRLTTFALAGLMSAALLSAGCQTDNGSSSSSSRTTTSTTRGSSSSSGYGADDKEAASKGTADTDATTAADTGKSKQGGGAHAIIQPSKAAGQDDVKGIVRFSPADKGVKVHAEITGLEPNSKHGFHVHEKGDLSDPELKSAGPHFNPAMHKHGGPHTAEHHAGDLGNLETDSNGKATYDATVEGITLDESKTGIIGRSVIVHAKADDLKTDPAGDSGARIAGGVIERGGGRGEKAKNK